MLFSEIILIFQSFLNNFLIGLCFEIGIVLWFETRKIWSIFITTYILDFPIHFFLLYNFFKLKMEASKFVPLEHLRVEHVFLPPLSHGSPVLSCWSSVRVVAPFLACQSQWFEKEVKELFYKTVKCFLKPNVYCLTRNR